MWDRNPDPILSPTSLMTLNKFQRHQIFQAISVPFKLTFTWAEPDMAGH